ncbi:terpene synthase 8 [Tripterygium wilfordii]|uniref:Terpene synthase 8 n=1 Tax=Tripterygium wilfordii TaxID=458696 RepID=A0A7J7CTU1_TRIWF|nr:terpene synthase 8 [Tripterygium wilfordii]
MSCFSIRRNMWKRINLKREEQQRGQCASSVECYRNEYGVSEEEAIKYIRQVIWNARKNINEEQIGG